MAYNVKLAGTVTIKLFVTPLDIVQNLTDFIYQKTNLECDWYKNDDDSYSITCTEIVNGRYYPSRDYYEQDECDYEFEFDENYYRKLVRVFEEDNELELSVAISDLEEEMLCVMT